MAIWLTAIRLADRATPGRQRWPAFVAVALGIFLWSLADDALRGNRFLARGAAAIGAFD